MPSETVSKINLVDLAGRLGHKPTRYFPSLKIKRYFDVLSEGSFIGGASVSLSTLVQNFIIRKLGECWHRFYIEYCSVIALKITARCGRI